jgi:3-dehydroquinate synthase
MNTFTIETKSKSYPLFIDKGLRHRTDEILKDLGKAYSSIFIISDSTIAPLYLQDVENSFTEGYPVCHYVIPSGEEAKSFENYYKCQTYALEQKLDRDSLVVALGGGVVGDLAGFVAATFMRGIPFIQMPTTLLAHDSSVGGKVAVNHPLGKNMIGAFHQPDAVIFDIEMLETLPEGQWRSGFAEVIKHSLIWDPDFYKWLKSEIMEISDLKEEKLTYALSKGILVKAAVVKEDEKEKGIRSYLNFGHTLGHALESELGYGQISHGDAVACGMLFAMRVSEDYYNTNLQLEEFYAWFRQFGFPSIPKDLDPERLIQFMKKDKKVQNGKIRMVLMKEIGNVETVTLEDGYILKWLRKECRG